MISKLSRKAPVVIAILAAAIAVTGCATFKKKHKTDLSYVERPVDVLYATGADRLDHHRWPEAWRLRSLAPAPVLIERPARRPGAFA